MANSRGRGNGDWNQYDDSPYASNYQASQGSPYGRSGGRTAGGSNASQGASPYDRAATGSAGYGQTDAYGSPYDQQAQTGSPYDQAGYQPQSRATQGSPYDAQDPYASAGRGSRSRSSMSSRNSRGGAGSGSGRVYQEGRGAAYTSTRPSSEGRSANRAAGVRPVTRGEYVPGLGGYGNDAASRGLSRRQLVAGGCAIGLVALLGVGGVTWWTHRAVACEVNGTKRDVPISSTAADLIKKGYASPVAGNLVSISDDANPAEILQQGGGNPYKLVVNGEEVDPASYRVKDSDKIEFQNGTDVVEESTKTETETPCGVQIPPDTDLLNVIGYVKQWGRNGISTVEVGNVSGRKIDRGVTTEPQDLIIAHSGINPSDGRKLIALTFDDGPSLEFTPQYLDVLARYGAKATFFNLGTNLEEGADYTALCKRCVDEGHQMASHTYSHDDKTLSGFDEAGRANEIFKAFQLVSDACGVPTQVMRPPYGEFRGWQFLQYIANHGDIAYSAYWGVDSLDWERKGVDSIVEACTHGLNETSYNGAVVLMHDGGGERSQDVEALPRIIEAYQGYGYELVTLNELLKSDPTYPEWVTSGYVTRPADAVIPDITPYMQ